MRIENQIGVLNALREIAANHAGGHSTALAAVIKQGAELVSDMQAFDIALAQANKPHSVHDHAYFFRADARVYFYWPSERQNARDQYFEISKNANGIVTQCKIRETPHNIFSLLVLALKYYLLQRNSKACLADLNRRVFDVDRKNEYAAFTNERVRSYFSSSVLILNHDMTNGFLCYLLNPLTKSDALRIAGEQFAFIEAAVKNSKPLSDSTSPASPGSPATISSAASSPCLQTGPGIFQQGQRRSQSQGGSPDSLFGRPELAGAAVSKKPLPAFSLPAAFEALQEAGLAP